jgi:hypothetical protein
MATALIGFTGYVGSTLLNQTSFDHLYRSTNIDEIRGREFSLLVCAGAPAAKWKANKEPDEDWANLQKLIDKLETVRAGKAILISTVDVYGRPIAVDEDTPIDEQTSEAYGRHRYRLEQFFTSHFPGASVVRLPGLFGIGLRKNFIFDLIQNPGALHLTHHESRFQFYDMSRLWSDLGVITDSGVGLVNMSAEPVRAGDVARNCFGVDFTNVTSNPPVQYDMWSKHAALFGGTGHYAFSQEQTLEGIRRLAAIRKAGE